MNFSYATKLVRNRVELAMRSTVQIARGSLGGFDEDTLMVTGITDVTVIYTGKAHVHNVNGAGVLMVGESPLDTRTVQISIPLDAPQPHRDDLVRITTDADPDLPNRVFRVLDVNVGGLLSAYHSMVCQGYYESRYWPS